MVNGRGGALLLRVKQERVVNVKAVAFCALVMMASPAAAQWGPYGQGRYVYDAGSLYGIEATLHAHGMRPVTRPVHSWPYIVVRATDPSGRLVRVLLNARYGNIVEVIPLPSAPVLAERGYPPPGAYPYPPAERRYGGARPDLKAEPDPVGPGVVYGSPPPNGDPQAHGAPRPQDSRASITPPRTPMPRPRPAQPTATAKVETPASTAPVAAAAPAPPAPEAEAAPAAPAASPPPPAAETAKPSFPPATTLE
jgi:hypothetical protein